MESDQELPIHKGEDDENPKKILVTSESDERMGGVYTKKKLTAAPINEEGVVSERKMSLVTKVIGDDEGGADYYYQTWVYLKEIGIPTVSSMRVVDKNTVIMGDMTHDGSEFFGKEKRADLLYTDTGNRELSNIEKKFLDIDPEEAKKAIVNLYEKAWNKGVLLPDDDPYDFIVHPDGSWEVIVLDLSQVEYKKRESEDFKKDKIEKMINMYDYIRKRLNIIGVNRNLNNVNDR